MKILCDDGPERVPVPIGAGRQDVVAKVAGPKTFDHVDEASENEQPCCLEVEIAAPAILVGHHEVVGGGDRRPGCGDGQGEEGARHYVAGLTPIEPWVGDEDLCARDQQSQEGDDREPVRNADERRMTVGIRIEGRTGG
jgi:hypothetical protein